MNQHWFFVLYDNKVTGRSSNGSIRSDPTSYPEEFLEGLKEMCNEFRYTYEVRDERTIQKRK